MWIDYFATTYYATKAYINLLEIDARFRKELNSDCLAPEQLHILHLEECDFRDFQKQN